FITPMPLNPGASLIQHSWDARADWPSDVPRCSAIVARPYPDLQSFPVWFLNLAGPGSRPPAAVVAMTVDGYLSAADTGTLTIDVTDGQRLAGRIDEQTVDGRARTLALAAGLHHVR